MAKWPLFETAKNISKIQTLANAVVPLNEASIGAASGLQIELLQSEFGELERLLTKMQEV